MLPWLPVTVRLTSGNKMRCQKLRTIVRTARDGAKTHLLQCANQQAKTYGKEVPQSTCDGCVLHCPFSKAAGCHGKKLKTQPVKDGSEIVYPVAVDVQLEGYTKLDDYTYQSDWGECPARAFYNEVSHGGDLIIRAYCAVTNKVTSFKKCQACKEGVPPAAAPSKEALNAPSLAARAWSYTKAMGRWLKSGGRVRSKVAVDEIYNNHCKHCDWFDSKEQACRGCGCVVSTNSMAIFNKIKMATEHCPKNLW